MDKWIIGLTGGIASGKSTVARHFTNLGADIIDADDAAKQVVKPGSEALGQIIEHFGSGIIQVDGTLNRKSLREHIFANPKERQWLEALLHPLIRRHLHHQAKESTGPYCVLVIPLLKTLSHYPYINKVIVVDCQPEVQQLRLMQRDQLDAEQAQTMIDSQPSRETRLSMADHIIVNHGSEASLASQVTNLHAALQ